MGQAFNRNGDVMGEAFGDSKRAVFDDLMKQHPDAAEIRIKSLEESGAGMEMPRYRSHKVVHALKIERVQPDSADAAVDNRETDGSARLFVEAPYSPIRVDHAYVHKHNPQPGGYYVVYEDGYASWSPADAFEGGYTRL